jgi:hypothetical protein
MKFKVVKRCQEDLSSVHGLLKSFLPFARKRMGFNRPPTIFFQSDQGNAQKLLGKTAHYEPATRNITIYVTGRHPKDVLRSLSHELVHHGQNCRGEFGHTPDTAPGYAQTDDHMRKMEEEAYRVGNLCFRDWEDSVKSGKIRVSIPLKESLIREQEEYTTVEGDTLSGIAGNMYGDIQMWPIIYLANKKQIGGNPDIVSPGMTFVIPDASEFNKLSKEEVNSIYSLSNYYTDVGDTMRPASAEEDSGKLDIAPEMFAGTGSPSQNAITEYGIWKGKKEAHPDVQSRLAAMWANIGWRQWQPKIPWSAAAVSWFFRSDPDFPKGAAHQKYIKVAKRNRRSNTPGYQYFTPEELNYEYIEDDIIGYIPRSYGKTHCDVYIGNGRCIGGNLHNTVALNRVINNRVSGEKIILVLRKVEDRNLQEWKNEELNKLLLEKFNLGVKK